MSAPTAPVDTFAVHVIATGPGVRTSVLGMLDHPAAEGVVAVPDLAAGVVLSAAHAVDEALAACPADLDRHRLAVMADVFSRDGVLRALGEGVRAMLHLTRTTPRQLVAALRAVRDGDGRLPHDVLVRVLGGMAGGDPPLAPAVPPPRLTARQVAVLRLMADGLGNADIAHALSCSEHTVKNVIYELMARMHARNRAHAVAVAVRLGLI